MAALDTVQEYISEARTLLQDTVEPYRYSDASLLAALNMGILEARRIRPDLFQTTPSTLPSYSAVDSTAVTIDAQYRVAFVYYICAHAHMRDQEETEDRRSDAFMAKYQARLLALGG